MLEPATCTAPRSARSRPPRTWRSVLLPTPEAPVIATISPRATVSERPRSTAIVPFGVRYDLARSSTSTIGASAMPPSAMTKRLRRIEARRLARRVDRREEADDQRGAGDDGDGERLDPERNVGDLVDVARNVHQPVAIEDERQAEAEQQAGCRADHADQGA